MQVLHPIYGDMGGPPTQLIACVRRVEDDGTILTEWRDFAAAGDDKGADGGWEAEGGRSGSVLPADSGRGSLPAGQGVRSARRVEPEPVVAAARPMGRSAGVADADL